MEKQINIYGEEIPVDKVNSHLVDTGGRIPIKSLFRSENGYKKGSYCKNCKSFIPGPENKCINIGTSKCQSTNINKNDIACNLYEENYDLYK